MRITRLLVLLALAALLAPRIEASRASVWESNPPASLTATTADEAGLRASLAPAAPADVDPAELPPFNLGEVVFDERALEHEDRFGLGPLDLLGPTPLRGPPPSYPKTRVRGFELRPPFRIGASASLSLWSHQACGFSCREVVSDSRYDPWGLESGGTFTADNPENKELKRRYMAGETPRTPQELAFERAVVGGAAGATALSVPGLGVAAAWPGISAQWAIGANWISWQWFVYSNAAKGNFDRAVEFLADLVTPDPRGHPERGAWVPAGARRSPVRKVTAVAARAGDTSEVVAPLARIQYRMSAAPYGPIAGTPETGIQRAWKLEVALIEKSGRGTRPWTTAEIERILKGESFRELGYTGHHLNKAAEHPVWQGDPRNIEFMRQGRGEEHMALGHTGGTRGPQPERHLIDREAMLRSLGGGVVDFKP